MLSLLNWSTYPMQQKIEKKKEKTETKTNDSDKT